MDRSWVFLVCCLVLQAVSVAQSQRLIGFKGSSESSSRGRARDLSGVDLDFDYDDSDEVLQKDKQSTRNSGKPETSDRTKRSAVAMDRISGQFLSDPRLGRRPSHIADEETVPRLGRRPSHIADEETVPRLGRRPSHIADEETVPRLGRRPSHIADEETVPRLGRRPSRKADEEMDDDDEEMSDDKEHSDKNENESPDSVDTKQQDTGNDTKKSDIARSSHNDDHKRLSDQNADVHTNRASTEMNASKGSPEANANQDRNNHLETEVKKAELVKSFIFSDRPKAMISRNKNMDNARRNGSGVEASLFRNENKRLRNEKGNSRNRTQVFSKLLGFPNMQSTTQRPVDRHGDQSAQKVASTIIDGFVSQMNYKHKVINPKSSDGETDAHFMNGKFLKNSETFSQQENKSLKIEENDEFNKNNLPAAEVSPVRSHSEIFSKVEGKQDSEVSQSHEANNTDNINVNDDEIPEITSSETEGETAPETSSSEAPESSSESEEGSEAFIHVPKPLPDINNRKSLTPSMFASPLFRNRANRLHLKQENDFASNRLFNHGRHKQTEDSEELLSKDKGNVDRNPNASTEEASSDFNSTQDKTQSLGDCRSNTEDGREKKAESVDEDYSQNNHEVTKEDEDENMFEKHQLTEPKKANQKMTKNSRFNNVISVKTTETSQMADEEENEQVDDSDVQRNRHENPVLLEDEDGDSESETETVVEIIRIPLVSNFRHDPYSFESAVTGGSVRQPVPAAPAVVVEDSGEASGYKAPPAPTYQTPAPSYQTPVQSYEAPVQSYQAPVDDGDSYEAPQQSYQAPVETYKAYDQCQPIVQYSVVTHQVFIPTTKEVVHTQYFPTTEYARLVETKYYGQSQVDVVTVTSVPEPEFITRTEVVTNPVYFARTVYSSLTNYVTATQLREVTQTRIAVITKYVTQVQYQTEVRYNTVTDTVTKYRTQMLYHTETVVQPQYHTETVVQPQYHTRTITQHVPQYMTTTEVRQVQVTKRVPMYQTVVQTQHVTQYSTVTTSYAVYSTIFNTKYRPQYVTITEKESCETTMKQGYY